MNNKIIKIRRSGNSNILTLPKEIQPKAQNFRVYEGRDGMIVYVPVQKNPFKDEQFIRAHENMIQKEEVGGTLFETELPD